MSKNPIFGGRIGGGGGKDIPILGFYHVILQIEKQPNFDDDKILEIRIIERGIVFCGGLSNLINFILIPLRAIF